MNGVLCIIVLENPLTGRQIRDALEEVCKNEYHQEVSYINGVESAFVAGQNSSYPYRHAILAHGKDLKATEFELEAKYDAIGVRNYSWPGSVYAIGYGEDSIVKAVEELAENLKQALK